MARVVVGLSGGVDSSVVAALLHKAIGDQLTCVFVDNGLLRKNEFQQVLEQYKDLGLNIKGVDAKSRFYDALKGESDPEKKRKAIGRAFIEVFDEEEGSVWENDTYELVLPRTEGDFEGTRIIGSANIVTALNMLNQKLVINNVANDDIKNTADMSYELFAEVLDELQSRKLIRKIPTKVRSTFKIIEGTNGSST